MLKKPDIADERLITTLRDNYALPVSALEFLALGYDIAAGVYRVTAEDGHAYFLKVREDAVGMASVTVPRTLYDSGIEQIIMPIANQSGSLLTRVDGFTLILYPFIEGHTGAEVGLTDSQWVEFGAVVRKIHAAHLPPETVAQVERETFTPTPTWLEIARQTHAEILTRTFDEPEQVELAEAWREHYDTISLILKRVVELGRRLKERDSHFVLCHADLHTANLLIDTHGRLFVVDWDQPVYALKERDLMFIVGGRVIKSITEREESLFFMGYGLTNVDFVALTYYRCAWVAQDIGSFAEQVFLMPDLSVEAKREAIKYFKGSLAPDSIADSALQFAYI